MLVLLFVTLWFILRGGLFRLVLVCSCVFQSFWRSGCFAWWWGVGGSGGGLILVLFVRLFDLRLFGFVCFLFRLVSGKGSGL